MTKEEIEYRSKFEETVSRISSRHQADLLQKTFNSMTDAVFILDAEVPPTILECNEAASAIFGYKKSEMLGKTTAFLHVNDENLREYQSLLYSTIREGKLNFFLPEYRMRHKDGSIFPTEHTVAQLLSEEGEQIGWVNTVKDLTEKKNIKEALRSIEESIFQFAEKAKDLIYRISKEKGFEYVNQASKAITGYTPEELYASPDLVYRSVHPEDLPKLQKLLEDLSEHRKLQPLEVRLFHKEGHLIVTEQINIPIYDKTGKLVAIEGILRDITERKRMEETLLESEERFKNIFDESPIGIVLYDSSIRVINANKASLDILGVSDVAKLKGLKLLKDPNMSSEVKKSLLRGESVVSDVTYNFDKVKGLKSYETKKSGIAYLHVVHTPIMRGKRLTGYLVQVQDVTERKKMEEQLEKYSKSLEVLVAERTRELREAQERLLRAERLAAIGEFAAMVGHDLRNPLTGIAGVAYILKKKLSPEMDEKIKELLEVIEKNVKYSNKIVSELLEYSREIQLELTRTNPKQVLKDTLTYIKVPRNIRLLDFTVDEPKIMVDAQKMQRVFANIIQNSIDAMPEGGELTIKSWEANGNLEIAFTDNGIGISKENMEKLFKPLFTTKAKGIGLGLPICKRIVEAHGGSVSVESVVGKGTTFTVTLPINQKIIEVENYE
nr:PAS domain S-box protein [Candidatus Freyarchaeota archaeon]